MSMQEMTLVEEANALASFNNLNHHSRHTEMCDERTVVSNELFQESERARLQAIERNTLLRRHVILIYVYLIIYKAYTPYLK